jgi:hypothetical protein
MTSSNAKSYWIQAAEGRRSFATLGDIAAFMGHGRRHAVALLRRATSSYLVAAGYLAESVHARMATHCAEKAMSHVAPRSSWTIGSLYSGVYDALAVGFRYSFPTLRRVFASELCVQKRESLRAAGYPIVYSTAATYTGRVSLVSRGVSCTRRVEL